MQYHTWNKIEEEEEKEELQILKPDSRNIFDVLK